MEKSLKKLLKAVPDSYPDFVNGMIAFLEDDTEISEKIIKYMQEHPDATTSEIIKYHTSIDNSPELQIVDDDELDDEK